MVLQCLLTLKLRVTPMVLQCLLTLKLRVTPMVLQCLLTLTHIQRVTPMVLQCLLTLKLRVTPMVLQCLLTRKLRVTPMVLQCLLTSILTLKLRVTPMVLQCLLTLPLGLDGNKFRMHLQTVGGKQLGIGAGISGQVYVHRARNNNGRTFEVTQAYENKVAGMTHFSKVNAAAKFDGVGLAATDTLGSAMGSLTIAAFPGAGDATKFNPGTYYNVHLTKDNTN